VAPGRRGGSALLVGRAAGLRPASTSFAARPVPEPVFSGSAALRTPRSSWRTLISHVKALGGVARAPSLPSLDVAPAGTRPDLLEAAGSRRLHGSGRRSTSSSSHLAGVLMISSPLPQRWPRLTRGVPLYQCNRLSPSDRLPPAAGGDQLDDLRPMRLGFINIFLLFHRRHRCPVIVSPAFFCPALSYFLSLFPCFFSPRISCRTIHPTFPPAILSPRWFGGEVWMGFRWRGRVVQMRGIKG